MTPPATEKGGETRRRILETAAELFLEHGYAGTSMNDIIRASGLTKGGFYFHFTSKIEVAAEALELLRTEMRQDILSAAGEHGRAVDQIAAIVRAVAANKANAPSGAALGRLCIELGTEPDVPPQDPFGEWFRLIAALFRQAAAEGDMDPAADADQAAHFAVTAYLGMDHVADVSGDPDGVTEYVEQFLAFTFRAVGIHVAVPAGAQPMGGAGHEHTFGEVIAAELA